MISTKSLGSMKELIVMEQLLTSVSEHFMEITKNKDVKKLLENAVFQSSKNLEGYQATLEDAK